MERHVIDRFRMGLALEEDDVDRIVPYDDPFVEIELVAQSDLLDPPFRTALRITHGRAEMPHGADFPRHIFFSYLKAPESAFNCKE